MRAAGTEWLGQNAEEGKKGKKKKKKIYLITQSDWAEHTGFKIKLHLFFFFFFGYMSPLFYITEQRGSSYFSRGPHEAYNPG